MEQSAGQKAVGEAARFMGKVNEVIIFPLITLLMAVAFLVFLYGCAVYIINAGNDAKRQEGVKHITFGVIGFVVMLSAWAILFLFTNTFGLGDELNCARDPNASGCDKAFQAPSLEGALKPPSR